MARVALAMILAASICGAQDVSARPLEGSALIDAEIRKAWEKHEVTPASKCDDTTFLRRVYLDMVGTIPDYDTTVEFIEDPAPDKRVRLVDELLAGDAFADYWAEKWGGILLGFSGNGEYRSFQRGMKAEVSKMFRENVPYDQFVRRLMDVNGKNEKQPLVFWWQQWNRGGNRTIDMAGKMTRTFLGIQLQCAQCHDHPFDKWTQEDFFGMAAYFARTRPRRRETNRNINRQNPRVGRKYEYILYEDRRGEIRIPKERKNRAPVFMTNGQGLVTKKNRRQSFTDFLTSRDNIQFSRAYVNRMWFYFFGRGIVTPFDNFTQRNRPSIPSLLDGLAEDFIRHDFDMKYIVRSIVLSEAYQLSSQVKNRDISNERYFAYAKLRPLGPDQLVNATFDSFGLDNIYMDQRYRYLAGIINRETVLRAFRSRFGRGDEAEMATYEGRIPHVLTMMNGRFVTTVVQALRGTTLDGILRRFSTPEARIDAIYLSFLTRRPGPMEKARLVRHVRKNPGTRAYEDILWVVLNSEEFLFTY